MKESGRRIRDGDVGLSASKLAIPTKVNMKIIKLTGKECTNGLKEKCTMANGSKERKLGMAFGEVSMVIAT